MTILTFPGSTRFVFTSGAENFTADEMRDRRYQVVKIRNPRALSIAREAIDQRALSIGASAIARQQANATALQELNKGRSTACALSVAYSVLSGRRAFVLDDTSH